MGTRAISGGMLLPNSRGKPLNAPAAFIHPCQPIIAKQPPSGPGRAHELKHDGYRLQIHVRDGRVKLYTITELTGPSATRLLSRPLPASPGSAILDAEVAWLDSEGIAQFDALHSRF
jgi:bifunctional non-homologous end joining protein LigD